MKALLLKLFFCLPVSLLAQFKIVNTEFTNSDTCVLYAGVDNDLTVIGRNDLNRYRIVSSNNSRISIQKNRISIFPAYNNGVDTLSIFRNKKLVFSKGYRILKLTFPDFEVGGTSDRTITVNQILANPFLVYRVRNWLYKRNIEISSYDCVIVRRGANANLTFPITGSALSAEALAAIKMMKTGDTIVFDEIKARSYDGSTRVLPPWTVNIILPPPVDILH